jgi:ADP-heptose:LPS heptosyltransferase
VLLLPIKIIPEHKQEHIAQLVDKIQELSKQLVMFGNKKTEQQSRLEEEMHRIDNELDQYIFYEVYELSKSDVDIIESNMMKK